MKLESVKVFTDDTLPGYELDPEFYNGSLQTVSVIRNGELLLKFAAEYGTLRVLAPAKPKMVTKYRVFGALDGMTIERLCDSMTEATIKQRDFADLYPLVRTEIVQVEIPEA